MEARSAFITARDERRIGTVVLIGGTALMGAAVGVDHLMGRNYFIFEWGVVGFGIGMSSIIFVKGAIRERLLRNGLIRDGISVR